jgi:hypothetical protein
MSLGVLVGALMAIAAAVGGFVWYYLKNDDVKAGSTVKDDYASLAQKDVEHIFNDQFREELRNRGRLHFEKIIGENAMFLQQDLRLTTSQLNEFMKTEITRTLKEEFARYEESINDAKQLAIDSIQYFRKIE